MTSNSDRGTIPALLRMVSGIDMRAEHLRLTPNQYESLKLRLTLAQMRELQHTRKCNLSNRYGWMVTKAELLIG